MSTSQVKVIVQESKVTRHTHFKIYSDRTNKQVYLAYLESTACQEPFQ